MAKLFTCLGGPTQLRQSILNMESKMILSSFMSQAENHKYSIQYLLISKVIYNVYSLPQVILRLICISLVLTLIDELKYHLQWKQINILHITKSVHINVHNN